MGMFENIESRLEMIRVLTSNLVDLGERVDRGEEKDMRQSIVDQKEGN